ncbi:MAG: hypothetical protein JWO59_3055 [Chloroflexi bacterium]|nr:hypothetical protein [Chloroflexota bacterium]
MGRATRAAPSSAERHADQVTETEQVHAIHRAGRLVRGLDALVLGIRQPPLLYRQIGRPRGSSLHAMGAAC